MEKITLLFISLLFAASAASQDFGLNLSGTVRKEFELNKKLGLKLSERIFFTPELIPVEASSFDPFNDIDLLPGSDDDDDDDDGDDDDDDDDDEASGSGGSTGNAAVLDASARSLAAELRSATSAELDWRIKKWLRLSGEYAFYWRPGRIRHGYTTDVRLEPKLPWKKVDFSWIVSLQHVGENRKKGFEVSHGLTTRARLAYDLTKAHQVYVGAGVNADIEQWRLEWDRARLETGLRYEFRDRHQFQFGYRFQSRITRKGRTSSDLSFSYTINL